MERIDDCMQAIRELKTRIDGLEAVLRELQGSPRRAMSSDPGMAAFANQLIEEISKELEKRRPGDDGKALGAMENGLLSDGQGVYLARYQLPNGMVLIWQREEDGVGFDLRVVFPNGKQVSYGLVDR